MARDRLAALRAQQQPAVEQESFPEPAKKPQRPRLSSRASFEESYEVYNFRSPSPELPLGPFSNPFEEKEPPRAMAQAQLPSRRPSDPQGTPRASQMAVNFESYSMNAASSPRRRDSGPPNRRDSGPPNRRGSLQALAAAGIASRRTHAYQTSLAHVQQQQQQSQPPSKPQYGHRRDLSSNSVSSAAPPYTPSFSAGRQLGDEKMGLGISDSVDTSLEHFFEELGKIQADTREYEDLLTRIETLHSRELSTVPESNEAQRVAAEFARVTGEAHRLSDSLKRRIQGLERTNGLGKDLTAQEKNVKRTQTAGAKNRFISAIQRYSSIESDHRAACRQRLAKQYRVVNPHATDAEVKQACEATDGGIFTSALLASARTDSARAALGAVHARQADLARLEHSISELAQLFNDMAYMVEEQQEAIEEIETKAEMASADMEAGHADLVQAKIHARSARARRWIIAVICCLILLAAAIAIIFVLKSQGVFNHTSAAPATTAWQQIPAASTIMAAATASSTSPTPAIVSSHTIAASAVLAAASHVADNL